MNNILQICNYLVAVKVKYKSARAFLPYKEQKFQVTTDKKTDVWII